MIDDHIQRTESTVHSAADVPAERKAEVLEHLAKLKGPIKALSETHAEEARSIAGMVEHSVQEATRPGQRPGLLQSALDGLRRSVEGFESSHPEMVETVNQFATSLANLGL